MREHGRIDVSSRDERAGVSRREFLAGTAAAGLGLAGAAAWSRRPAEAQALAGPVNWLVWTTYVLPDVTKSFKDQFGATVNVVPFSDNPEAFTKVKLGGGKQYDIAQADAFWPVTYYESKLIEPIDFEQMSSAKSLFPEFRNFKAWQTKDGMLMYPNCWSPNVLIYNKKYVKAEPTSYEVLFDPKYKGRVAASKGFNYGGYFLPLLLGYDPFGMDKKQLEDVKKLALSKYKPNLRQFVSTSAEMVKLFVDETIWIAVQSTPARTFWIKSEGGPDVGWTIPKEGTTGWIDGDMLVAGAEHKAAALRYINHRATPEHMLKLVQKVKYPPTNRETVELLKKQGQEELVRAHEHRPGADADALPELLDGDADQGGRGEDDRHL